MAFLSLQFAVLFAATAALYYLLPHRARWALLLAASYVFYLSADLRYGVFLAVSTLTTYASGILIARAGARRDRAQAVRLKKFWVACSVAVNIGILAVFKYLNFFGALFAQGMTLLGRTVPEAHWNLLLPLGISFYTFQVLSYTVDVYRGDVEPQVHLGKYALFVSFFPQITSGPIQQAKRFLPQLDEAHPFDADGVSRGLLRMLWGVFQKMVVADRLRVLVDTVYNSPGKYGGVPVAAASVCFAFELYCDFAGYSNMAVGAARVFGFRFAENFNRPYFSKSIREFWRRWHMTLGAWLRDYLYFPLGGSRCSRGRRFLNLMIVFTICGLWHGASLSFVVWGALHGLYQILGILLHPSGKRLSSALGLRDGSFAGRVLHAGITFVLVDFAWIFFRANRLKDALTLIRSLFRFSPADLWNGTLFTLGLTAPEFWAGLAGVAVVLAVDLLGRKRDLPARLLSWNTAGRWAVCLAVMLAIAVFGAYGSEYGAQQFIYSQF